MFPLGVLCKKQSFHNWSVMSTHGYSKTENTNRAMLLTSAFATTGVNETWLTATEQHNYVGESAITFNITANTLINVNPVNNGLSHTLKAKCYDIDDNLLGYVGFVYTFANTGSTKFGVYVTRDVGVYSYSEQSSGLNVPTFDSADVFILSVDITTRTWGVSKGISNVDGSAVLGLIPVNTAYVKYEISFFIGPSVAGTAEISVLSLEEN